MDKVDYDRCADCDEQGVFTDGSVCARCLGLGYIPVDEDEREDQGAFVPVSSLAA
jgi:hypothetical protein